MRTCRPQKPPNILKNKKAQKSVIHLHRGSPLYFIEADNSCAIRHLQRLVENPSIDDAEFRHYVRTLIFT